MRVPITDEGDSPHQPDNTFIVGQARNCRIEFCHFTSEPFPGNRVKGVNVATRKFGGKIAQVCAPGVRRDVCGRVLRCARGQKNGER